ncbi:hypothetical protein PPERSA_12118 [Pseudocohnilembus persalinus]|uniref:Uncharacterized protein n=1 Tax=Pseudocohnilembus persalinus TaxID=266149 RepID=A0A0V0QNI5_PSEPJ|nr:hypothetical protein PPERSA_12118 [Pseudocohnilembus persalinus]|eukprot:KRX03913.1 hypothetical protein PPERSA_12118 [Pseudocohnilembus persalinus]
MEDILQQTQNEKQRIQNKEDQLINENQSRLEIMEVKIKNEQKNIAELNKLHNQQIYEINLSLEKIQLENDILKEQNKVQEEQINQMKLNQNIIKDSIYHNELKKIGKKQELLETIQDDITKNQKQDKITCIDCQSNLTHYQNILNMYQQNIEKTEQAQLEFLEIQKKLFDNNFNYKDNLNKYLKRIDKFKYFHTKVVIDCAVHNKEKSKLNQDQVKISLQNNYEIEDQSTNLESMEKSQVLASSFQLQISEFPKLAKQFKQKNEQSELNQHFTEIAGIEKEQNTDTKFLQIDNKERNS